MSKLAINPPTPSSLPSLHTPYRCKAARAKKDSRYRGIGKAFQKSSNEGVQKGVNRNKKQRKASAAGVKSTSHATLFLHRLRTVFQDSHASPLPPLIIVHSETIIPWASRKPETFTSSSSPSTPGYMHKSRTPTPFYQRTWTSAC